MIIDPIIIPLINELNAKVLVSIKRLINFDEEIKLIIKAITKIVTSNKSYSSGNLKCKRQLNIFVREDNNGKYRLNTISINAPLIPGRIIAKPEK